MARPPKELPHNFPPRLLIQMLKSETCRQAGMIRQEILTELLSIVEQTSDPSIRKRLIRLVEINLKAGLSVVEKSEELWPASADAEESFQTLDSKESIKARHLRLYQEWDKRHARSLELLQESFSNIRLILAKARPPSDGSRLPSDG
jgi:hypothetical protein